MMLTKRSKKACNGRHVNSRKKACSSIPYRTTGSSSRRSHRKRYRKLNRFAEANPEFFDGYFDAITQMAVDYFTVNELPKRQQEFRMLKNFRSNLSHYHASAPDERYPHNRVTRAFSRICPLARLVWQGIKGGIAFI